MTPTQEETALIQSVLGNNVIGQYLNLNLTLKISGRADRQNPWWCGNTDWWDLRCSHESVYICNGWFLNLCLGIWGCEYHSGRQIAKNRRQLHVDGVDVHSLCRMQYSVCSRKEMQKKGMVIMKLSLHQTSATSSTGQWSEPYTSVWIPADCSFSSRHLEVIK